MAQGFLTKVLAISLDQVEKSIKIISQNGENLEKKNFFEKFDWY